MTMAMGFFSNYPIAIAAGLGINGIVAFGLVLTLGLTPAGAMGVIVIEGIVITVLVLVGLREAIMNAVPLSLKRAIGVGIGLFILFIGFVDGGLITHGDPGGPVPVAFVFPNSWAHMADRHRPADHGHPLRAQGAGGTDPEHRHHVGPGSPRGSHDRSRPTSSERRTSRRSGAFDLGNVFATLGLLTAILTIFTIMLADFFDTMGTATAITEQAGLTTRGRHRCRASGAFCSSTASPRSPVAPQASARTPATSKVRPASPRAAVPASPR